jgi:hypothetical protein
MLGLQFIGPAFLLAGAAALTIRTHTRRWLPLLVFFSTTVLFAISYRVNDRFVFFLPGYLVIALFVGRGWQLLREKRPTLARITLPLLAIVPILTYAILPSLLQSMSLPLPNIRDLPGREPVSFFLWPAKNGYYGAAEYGSAALSSLPPDSILLADHTPYETLAYLQIVESVRPDIQLVKIEPEQDLGAVLEELEANRPIYLADNNPAYYNLASLPASKITRAGMVYKVEYE